MVTQEEVLEEEPQGVDIAAVVIAEEGQLVVVTGLGVEC